MLGDDHIDPVALSLVMFNCWLIIPDYNTSPTSTATVGQRDHDMMFISSDGTVFTSYSHLQ